MAMPISAFFKRGRVVHPIAGHRHDMTLRLPGRHHPQFVRGRNPGINADILHFTIEHVASVHRLQFCARHHTPAVTSNPNSRATAWAVSGWSPVIITGRMPASFTHRDRGLCLRDEAGRSFRPVRERSFQFSAVSRVSIRFGSDRQNAQRLAGHALAMRKYLLAPVASSGHRSWKSPSKSQLI